MVSRVGTCDACHREKPIIGYGLCSACYPYLNTLCEKNTSVADKKKAVIEFRKTHHVNGQSVVAEQPTEVVRQPIDPNEKTCIACHRPGVPIMTKGLCKPCYSAFSYKYDHDDSHLPDLIEWRKSHPVVVKVGKNNEVPADFKSEGETLYFDFLNTKIPVPDYVARRSLAEYIKTCSLSEIKNNDLLKSAIACSMSKVNLAQSLPETKPAKPHEEDPEETKRTYKRTGRQSFETLYPREGYVWSEPEKDALLNQWSTTGSDGVDLRKNKALAKTLGRRYESCFAEHHEIIMWLTSDSKAGVPA